MGNQFGKTSRLRLTAAADRNGRTFLEDVYFTAPFKVMHPFYEKKGVMTVMLLTASAGIMAGDRQEFEITVKEHADMEFVSQAYEKIHRMEGDHAERYTRLAVGRYARLCYTPLPAIPFASSDYRSTINVELEDGTSEFVFSEVLTCGRLAHGERFGYDRFQNRINVYQGGRLVYMDNTRYEPEFTDMDGYGMYEGFTHLASLLIFNRQVSGNWMTAARQQLDAAEDMEGGVTRTALGHIVVRILGKSGQKLTAMMEQLLTLDEK